MDYIDTTEAGGGSYPSPRDPLDSEEKEVEPLRVFISGSFMTEYDPNSTSLSKDDFIQKILDDFYDDDKAINDEILSSANIDVVDKNVNYQSVKDIYNLIKNTKIYYVAKDYSVLLDEKRYPYYANKHIKEMKFKDDSLLLFGY